MSIPMQRHQGWQRAMLLAIASVALHSSPTPAQTRYPDCQPPGQGEYILLVVSQTAASQAQLQRTLPTNVNTSTCNYQSNVVTRIGGFTSLDVANSWAQYITEIGGLSAYVMQPAAPNAIAANTASTTPSTIPPAIPQTTSTPQTSGTGYSPRVLGEGYAVLVSYFNKPDVAIQVQKLTGREVGLVAYGQRPYLLVHHSASQGTANATLKALTDRGFQAQIVDSRRVVLLKQAVKP